MDVYFCFPLSIDYVVEPSSVTPSRPVCFMHYCDVPNRTLALHHVYPRGRGEPACPPRDRQDAHLGMYGILQTWPSCHQSCLAV